MRAVLRSYGVALFALTLCSGIMAQDADPCEAVPSTKAAKLIEKGTDKRKYDADKRRGYLEDALEEDDTALEAGFALGLLAHTEARRNGGSLSEAQTLLLSVHEACSRYNEEVPYTLGAIAYAEGRHQDALDWFDRFLQWEARTGQPIAPRNRKRIEQVNGVLPELQFLLEFNAHADAPPPRVLAEVASRDAEYLPALSADGTLLFFTRAGERKAKGDLISKPFEEFTWARRTGPATPFDSGVRLEDPFNRSGGYGGASISVDNRSLYLAIKSPAPGNPENIDLYSTRYSLMEDTGDEQVYLWTDPEPLSVLNTPDGWESQPAISPDGQTLYFAAIRPGTTPDEHGNPTIDVLASHWNGTQWTEAVVLPAPINGPCSDKAPFLHPDGRTLYFASNREPGGGGYDIWMSKLDSLSSPFEADAWSAPINLGTPLNTEGDEHGLVISADGGTAYFSSRRPGTQGLDIMTWSLPESLRPRASVVVRGQLDISDDLRDTPIALELRYAQSRRAQAIDLGDDGAYAAIVDLAAEEDVLLVAKADGAAFTAGLVVDREDPSPALVNADLTIRSVGERDAAFEIEDIHYATGSAVIDRTSRLMLDLFAEYLMDTGLSVEIGGHTDDVGLDTDNLALSQRRADAVRDHLVAAGVPDAGLTARGYGESRPRADNTTEAGRAKNRRTEFRILTD